MKSPEAQSPCEKYDSPSVLDLGDARELTNGGTGPKDEEDPNIVWGQYAPDPDDPAV